MILEFPKRPETLTPDSPRWEEFCDRLADVLEEKGCDGDFGANRETPKRVLQHARRILAEMGDVDVLSTLSLFGKLGGYCDCEILMNVDGPDFRGRLRVREELFERSAKLDPNLAREVAEAGRWIEEMLARLVDEPAHHVH